MSLEHEQSRPTCQRRGGGGPLTPDHARILTLRRARARLRHPARDPLDLPRGARLGGFLGDPLQEPAHLNLGLCLSEDERDLPAGCSGEEAGERDRVLLLAPALFEPSDRRGPARRRERARGAACPLSSCRDLERPSDQDLTRRRTDSVPPGADPEPVAELSVDQAVLTLGTTQLIGEPVREAAPLQEIEG